jgi:hypothetical protein
MKEVITKREAGDKLGMIIPKGTTLFIIKELVHPMTKKAELIVYVDNGTGDKNLMPKTIVVKDLVI